MLLNKNNTKICLTCQQFECTEYRFSENDRVLTLDFYSKQRPSEVYCNYCGSSSIEVHDNNTTLLKDLPIWTGIKQVISVWYHRYKCRECNRVFSEDIGFKEPDTRVTVRAAAAIRE